MKSNILFLFILLCFGIQAYGQQVQRQTIAVLRVDVQGLHITPEHAGNILRLEAEKLDSFEMIDKYDVFYSLKRDSFEVRGCYGKNCLVEAGKLIKADKMLTGSIEKYGEGILVTLRLIDVAKGQVVKTQVREFLDIPTQTHLLIQVMVRELFGLKNEEFLLKQLTQKTTQETYLNNPAFQNVKRLRLDGPRMGATVFMGALAERLQESNEVGGFEAIPVMFQFGYQFEKQYLNEGRFQALFEFIPMLTGLDQGLLLPSFTILNGLRNNKSGWEFAFGPTIRFVNQSEGYFDNGIWRLKDDRTPATQATRTRLDRRGDLKISTGFVLAFGKTFRSGRLNIPLNVYIIPHKDGIQTGLSFGFNAKNQ